MPRLILERTSRGLGFFKIYYITGLRLTTPVWRFPENKALAGVKRSWGVAKYLTGFLFGDKAYISQKLFDYDKGFKLITI